MTNLILIKDIAGNLESDYEVESLDLHQEYWSPAEEGETRRAIFWGISSRRCLDQQTGKEIDLDCAVFILPGDNDDHTQFANGSKRLVGVCERLKQGTPVQITYKGKKKNATNSNQSDLWEVRTLRKKS